MNTTTAALQANVTTATIRTWCRRGVIAATKTAGRWIIDTASLAHRIAISAMRTRKAVAVTHPLTLTADLNGYRGILGVRGPAAVLQAAFEAGTPVTLSGKYEGESVFLGFTSYDSLGRPQKTVGLDHQDAHTAVYVINSDLDRLHLAPKVSAAIDAILDATDAEQARADAADDAYLNGYYE